jgi:hypothetical protein
MTGETTTSWSWLHSLAVPAVVAAVEATWISAWLGVAAHVGPHHPADVPWLAVAAPAVVAVGAGTLRPRLPHPELGAGRVAARVLSGMIVVAAMAATAGILTAVLSHAGWATAGFQPWDLHDPVSRSTLKLAWWIAVVTWLGGLWLGSDELRESQAVSAVGLAVAALTLLFVAAAVDHSATLHRTTGRAAVLLLAVVFPGGGAVLALVHERDLERRSLRRPSTTPSGAWLAALAGPMAVVSAVAVLVALAVGPLAPLVGRGLRLAALGVAAGIVDALRWLGHFLPHGQIHLRAPTQPVRRQLRLAPLRPGRPSEWVTIVLVVVAALAVGTLLVMVARALLRLYRGRTRRAGTAAAAVEGERVDSVFSWGHLLQQIRAWARRRVRALTRQHAAAPADRGAGPPASPEPVPDSVRAHYRRLLAAAGAAGHGRSPSETPLELERRLAFLHPEGAGDHLDELTQLYDRVRYGREPDGVDQTDSAGRHVNAITAWLAPPDEAGTAPASGPSIPPPHLPPCAKIGP